MSLFSCPEKVPVPQVPAQGGGSRWGLPDPCSLPCLRPPLGLQPGRKAGQWLPPSSSRWSSALSQAWICISPSALPAQAPREQVTVKPPLLASGLRALISFQVFSRMGVGIERVAVAGFGEEGMRSPFWRAAGVPPTTTLVSEAVLFLPPSSLCSRELSSGEGGCRAGSSTHEFLKWAC